MTAARTGGYPPTFPHREQPVAFRGISQDRSSDQSRRARLATHAATASLGDTFVRLRSVLSLFAASLVFLAPVHAVAQDQENNSVSVRERGRPEYDPLGVRFGGFNLHATLDLGVTSTDNLFAEEAGEQDDMIYEAGLRGRLESNWTRHALTLEAGATTVSHEDFEREDYDTSYAGAIGRLDIGSNSSVTARARVAHDVESRRDPDAPPETDPIVEFDRTEMAVTGEHRFSRFRVTGTAGQLEHDYEGTSDFRDFEETRLTGRVEGEVSPRMGLFLEATTDERDYDNSPNLNSEGRTYLVGATLRFTDLMRGEVAVGQFEREYQDPALNSDGLAVAANVEWYITRLTTISLYANRNAEQVVGDTAVPFVDSRYGGRIDHELLRNLILTAGAQVGTREYDDLISRDDDYFTADAGADWLLNRRLVVRGRFEMVQVESDDPTAEFEENRITLGLGIRL
jgi:hypothetical protein